MDPVSTACAAALEIFCHVTHAELCGVMLVQRAEFDDRHPRGPGEERQRRRTADAAAPFAPMAMPTSAATSAGASLTSSPIIITGPAFRSDRTTMTF